MSDSLPTHVIYSPWNSPGQITGVGSLSLLQGIFPTQGSNPGLPHCRRILYQLSHQESPEIRNRQPKHLCLILVQLILCAHCSFFVSFSSCLKQLKKICPGRSLVLQWLRIHLPVQQCRFWSLVGERRSHVPQGYWAGRLQLLTPHHDWRVRARQRRIPHDTAQTWYTQANKLKKMFFNEAETETSKPWEVSGLLSRPVGLTETGRAGLEPAPASAFCN